MSIWSLAFSLIIICAFPFKSDAYIDSGRGSTLVQRLAAFVALICSIPKRIVNFFRKLVKKP